MGSHESAPKKFPRPCRICMGKGMVTEEDNERNSAAFRCGGCGEIDDQYMVYETVWKEAGLELDSRRCLRCLQNALPRPLLLRDFTSVPINRAIKFGYLMAIAKMAMKDTDA